MKAPVVKISAAFLYVRQASAVHESAAFFVLMWSNSHHNLMPAKNRQWYKTMIQELGVCVCYPRYHARHSFFCSCRSWLENMYVYIKYYYILNCAFIHIPPQPPQHWPINLQLSLLRVTGESKHVCSFVYLLNTVMVQRNVMTEFIWVQITENRDGTICKTPNPTHRGLVSSICHCQVCHWTIQDLPQLGLRVKCKVCVCVGGGVGGWHGSRSEIKIFKKKKKTITD